MEKLTIEEFKQRFKTDEQQDYICQLEAAIRYFIDNYQHFYDQINWGSSFFDANSLNFANNAPINFNKALIGELKVQKIEYELRFEGDSWIPMETSCIKHPDKISEYIEKGIIRKLDKPIIYVDI